MDETQEISSDSEDKKEYNPQRLSELVLPIICSFLRNIKSIEKLELPKELELKLRDYYVLYDIKLKRSHEFVHRII